MKIVKPVQIVSVIFCLLFLTFSSRAFSRDLNNDAKSNKIDKQQISIPFSPLISHTMNIDSTYKGCVEGDCKNGNGVYIYKDGTRYEGTFKNGLAEGKGTCYYSDGDMYTGNWKQHNYHGYGTLYESNGTISKGMWNKGEFLGEIPEDKEIGKRQKTWVIGVGVARYSFLRSLKYSDDDAYRMYAFFKSPIGGLMPDNRMNILIDEDATYENITKILSSLKEKVVEEDTIVFYFSGHIIKNSIIPIDGRLDDKLIAFEKIESMLSECKAKTKIAIIDGRTIEKEPVGSYQKKLENGDVTFLISAKEDEFSRENEDLRQGVFSHFLIKGLKGSADLDENKVITITELFEYVKVAFKNYEGSSQTPVMYGENAEDAVIGTLK